MKNNRPLRYGLWISLILFISFLGPFFLWTEGGSGRTGEIVGYAGMFASMLLLVLGILKKRNADNVDRITFGDAFRTGATITLSAGILFFILSYAFFEISGDAWMKRYYEHQVERIRSTTVDPAAADTAVRLFEEEWKKSGELYKNSAFQAGVMLFTLVPVGLLLSLTAAAMLRRS